MSEQISQVSLDDLLEEQGVERNLVENVSLVSPHWLPEVGRVKREKWVLYALRISHNQRSKIELNYYL